MLYSRILSGWPRASSPSSNSYNASAIVDECENLQSTILQEDEERKYDESYAENFQLGNHMVQQTRRDKILSRLFPSQKYTVLRSSENISDGSCPTKAKLDSCHPENVCFRNLKLLLLIILSLATGYLLHPILKATSQSGRSQFLSDWGKPGYLGEGLAKYPTDFTRDVLPIPCHSHNDYWRRVPLYEAIHYGMTSVEADVWLINDDLYVGHDTASLTLNRTFRSLYVNPIFDILEKQNPSTHFSNTTKQGVFDEDPSQTLILLVDIKTSGNETLPHVKKHLDALRSKDYLTYFDGEKIIPGPITVVGTGNTPFNELVASEEYRDIFFDAPLHLMGVDQNSNYNIHNSYYASTSLTSAIGHIWRGYLTESQLATIRVQVNGARQKGLIPRYWDTPGWPVWLRNHVWQVLLREGVGMLNVDDLEAAAKKDWRKEGDWFSKRGLGLS